MEGSKGIRGIEPESHAVYHADTEPAQEETEHMLMTQAVVGDKKAFGKLYELHQPALRRWALKECKGSTADADDLVNTTFVKALDAIGSFDMRASFKNWLFSIARNFKKDEWRKAHVRERDEDELTGQYAEFAQGFGGDSPEAAAAKREELRRIQHTLDESDPKTAEIFTEYLEGGGTLAEIAKKHGMPVNTVKTKIFGMRKKLDAARAARTQEGEEAPLKQTE